MPLNGPDLVCGFRKVRVSMVPSSLASQAGSAFSEPCPKSQVTLSPKVTVPSPSVCAMAAPGSIAAMSPPATRLVMYRFFTKHCPVPPDGHTVVKREPLLGVTIAAECTAGRC